MNGILKLDLSKHTNKEILENGNIKVYFHNDFKGYCTMMKNCREPTCYHGILGIRWPEDNYFCITDTNGNIIQQ